MLSLTLALTHTLFFALSPLPVPREGAVAALAGRDCVEGGPGWRGGPREVYGPGLQ